MPGLAERRLAQRSAAGRRGAARLADGSWKELLATQTASHGGPVAYVEGPRRLAIDAAAPPAPVTVVSGMAIRRLWRAAATAIAARPAGAARCCGPTWKMRSIPPGWAADSSDSLLRKGAVGLAGDERTSLAALRRGAALLRNWAPLLAGLRPVAMPNRRRASCPKASAPSELVSPAASAVSHHQPRAISRSTTTCACWCREPARR